MRNVVAAILLVGGALALLPLIGLPLFYESFLYLVFHWVVLATSWNILSGYSGYFSFGHGAFFGAGMYTTAVLATRYEVPFLLTLPAAALVATLLGVALGAVVFRVKRVRGELFALATLAFTFVVGTIVLNTPIDGGPGIALSGVAVPSLGRSAASSFYLLALALGTGTLVIAYAVYVSKLGTGLFAIHDDEDVAEVLGVPTFRYKMAAFAISCALAGVAGGLQALFVSYVTVSETFSITVPLSVVLMSVLGGTRHWAGPAVGATLITGLLYAFTAGDHALAGKVVFGVVLIAVILFMPDGVLGRFTARRQRRRRTPRITLAQEPIPAPPRVPRVATSEPLLVARGIRKAFSGVHALDGVDLEVRRGEILGLLGPNGSGKSTFINLVSGHYRADAGSLLFEGFDIARRDAHRIARAGIGRTYQIPRPFTHLSVQDNVALPAMFGAAALHRPAAIDEARRWLAFTGLSAQADAFPEDLNLHQRKFLELARALAARPRLLLLDEVLSGLTPGEINDAVDLIRAIRDDGATIVFVEHVMRAVMALSDRLVVLDHGVVIAEGNAAAVMDHPDVVTAFLGAPLLELRDVQVNYGAAVALRGVCLHVAAGELVCVVGPNGAGKSTLINAIAGLHPVTAGAMTLNGRDLTGLPAHRFCAEGIAVVPEGRRLFTALTVRENLELGSYLPAAKALRRASLDHACALFPALVEKLEQPAGALSGGQQQMVAIARALMARPRLLLLDEPSLGLAPLIVREMFAMIERIHAEGVAVLLVEQNVALALDVATRAYVLEEGRVVAEDAPAALRLQPHIRRVYLGLGAA